MCVYDGLYDNAVYERFTGEYGYEHYLTASEDLPLLFRFGYQKALLCT